MSNIREDDTDLDNARGESLLRTQGAAPLFPDLSDSVTKALMWYVGKQELIEIGQPVAVVASTIADIGDIVPSDDTEEWAVLVSIAHEQNAIDANDQVMFFQQHYNLPSAIDFDVPMPASVINSTSIPQTVAYGHVWCNPSLTIQLPSFPSRIVRRRNKDQIDTAIHLRVKTTATAGGRAFQLKALLIKRRSRL